jgi:hypothetical protein
MEGTGQLVLGGCRVAADPFHTDTVCNAGVGTECSPSFYGKKEKERTEKKEEKMREAVMIGLFLLHGEDDEMADHWESKGARGWNLTGAMPWPVARWTMRDRHAG